jgi:hypothetical protein
MANLNIHPAPGMGDLTSGFFVVPQNPVTMATEGISRVPTLGEFMSAAFVVPQNPFLAYVSGAVKPLGQGGMGDCGCGCGGHGSCGGGMGALDLSSLTSLATEDSLGFGAPNWAYAAGALALYLFAFGGSTGPSRVGRARRAYRSYASA